MHTICGKSQREGGGPAHPLPWQTRLRKQTGIRRLSPSAPNPGDSLPWSNRAGGRKQQECMIEAVLPIGSLWPWSHISSHLWDAAERPCGFLGRGFPVPPYPLSCLPMLEHVEQPYVQPQQQVWNVCHVWFLDHIRMEAKCLRRGMSPPNPQFNISHQVKRHLTRFQQPFPQCWRPMSLLIFLRGHPQHGFEALC